MQLVNALTLTQADSSTQAMVGLEQNQATYHRLRLALSLYLRRQIFLAVCDDLSLRNQLITQLHADLEDTRRDTTKTTRATASSAETILAELLQDSAVEGDYPTLVSLSLDLANPDPFAQMANWLAQYPPRSELHQSRRIPGFQILGIEHLTHQAAPTQQRFLLSLQQVERSLSGIESSLVLWLPRPWLHAIQQSAPAFWNCHTALFEFEGDPTPSSTQVVVPIAGEPAPVATSPLDTAAETPPISITQPSEAIADAQVAEAANGVEEVRDPLVTSTTPVNDPICLDANGAEDLWDILTYDLATLDEYDAEPALEVVDEEPDGSITSALTNPVADAMSAAATGPDALPTAALEPSLDTVIAVTSDTPDNGSVLTPSAEMTPALEPEEPAAELLTLISQVYAAETLFTLARSTASVEGTPAANQILTAIQRIEQLQQMQARGNQLAIAYQTLGNLYRDRIEQGDIVDQTLIIAIYAYEQTLKHLEDDTLPLWADVLNDMGNLYWMLSRQFTDAAISLVYLEQGINAYQLALQKTDPAVRPQTYAMLQNNLGSAYGDLARYRNTVEVLQKSVQAYEAALRYRRPGEDPPRYAATQNNLGTAYWNLAQYQQPVRCLTQAIAAYHAALSYYSPEQEPMHYAMLQNNLGTAYWNLAQHARNSPQVAAAGGHDISAAELLKQAINAYTAALAFRTLEVAPNAHAATQNNLGTAYWHLALLAETESRDRQQYLLQAINAYKSALAAVHYLQAASTNHAPALTFDPTATQSNLGLAYYQLAIDQHIQQSPEQRADCLELALQHQIQVLRSWEHHPDYYQTALSYVVQTIRAFHNIFGLQGQSRALSKVPANFMPELLKRL